MSDDAPAEPPYTAEDLNVWAYYQLDATMVWASMHDDTDPLVDAVLRHAFQRLTTLLRDNAWSRQPYQTFYQQNQVAGAMDRCPVRDPDDHRASNRRRCSSAAGHPGDTHGMFDVRANQTFTWRK